MTSNASGGAMRIRRMAAPCLLSLLALAAIGHQRAARATENAAGHYITGALVGPAAGVVPPEPGLYWGNQEVYYSGSLNRSVAVPVNGRLELGLEARFFSSAFSAVYVPKLDLGPFTLGFGLTLPIVQSAHARVFTNRVDRSDTATSFGDMVITPIMLGWHSGGHFAQARLDIFAPTGKYDVNDLANVGMNYWTFTPTLAYSNIGRRHDVSVNVGLDINTRNPKTDYTSGALLHIDAAAIYDVVPGLGLGVSATVLRQVTDDQGGIAAQLNGFRGRAYAVGPVLRYNFQLGGAHFSTTFSWSPEFGVQKRTEGNTFQFRVTGSF